MTTTCAAPEAPAPAQHADLMSAAYWVPFHDLAKWDKNPRKNKKAVPAVARSIRTYGFVAPVVVWQSKGRLVAGHTRIAALEQLLVEDPGFVPRDAPGVGLVPVRFHEFTDESEAAAYAIADNRLTELADWDDELLGQVLAELRLTDEQMLAETGFSEAAIERLIREAGGDEGGAEDPGAEMDRVAELAAAWGTAAGQLWQIPSATVPGRSHRLLCGDATNRDDVLRLLDGQQAALCATDPPYLVDYTGERPGGMGKDWSAHYHEVDIKDVTGFFRAVFENVLEVLAPNAAIYCWHAHKRVVDIIRVWRELDIHDHQQIVWVKPCSVLGRVFWHFRHEPCLMGWRKGSMPPHDGDQSVDSVWELDWQGKGRVVGNLHPTEKPIEVFARPMRKHTRRGDICLEMFSGSGSQLVAAEQEGRLCYALELEPAFVAVALQRLAGMGLAPRQV